VKKSTFFILSLLPFIAACLHERTPISNSSRQASPEPQANNTVADPVDSSGYTKNGKKSLFDDDIEGFVLEEEANPFTAPLPPAYKEQPIQLLHSTPDAEEPPQEHTEQARYGLKNIYFDFDQYIIRPDQKVVLDYNLDRITKLAQKGHTVVVEGHACNSAGSAVYNMMLSEKRAHEVADYLVCAIIPRTQLKTVGRGAEMLIVPEGTVEQQAPNRRVEFYVLN
jgi:outer membrane protein OmpA-like peptidoglycan-associated protein